MNNEVIVIIPAYNEEKKCVSVIKSILENFKGKIIVINDGSLDRTKELLVNNFSKNKRIILIHNNTNLGKGASMRIAVDKAWEYNYKQVVFIDADGQHKPEKINDFIKALENNNLVFGYRNLKRNVPLVRKLGNIIVNYLMKVLFNIKRKDNLCGFFAFDRSVYNQIIWKSNRYGVETEVATIVGRKKIDFKEIHIETIYLDKNKGLNIWNAILVMFNIPIWYFRKN